MRRAYQREMEASLAQPNGALPTKFYNKVMEIPVVKYGVDSAHGFYGRVKDFNTITSKSLGLAESLTGAVVGRVKPLAHRGISLASNPLQKIDNFAAQGLQSLEDKVPVINKEPQVMVSDMTGAVTAKLTATKERVTNMSEGVLVSGPVQTYFNMVEYILQKVSNTMDKVLPPGESEEGERPGGGDERLADRGWILLGRFFGLLGTAKTRVIRRVRNRIESTSNAADAVFKEAKKAVNQAIPISADKDLNESTNGDSKSGGASGNANANCSNKAKKNKNKNGDAN